MTVRVTSERHAPHVLYVYGDVLGEGEMPDVAAVVDELTAHAAVNVVLDLSQVGSIGPGCVAALNELGATAALRGATIMLQVPHGQLTELTTATFNGAVRVEQTRRLRLVEQSTASERADAQKEARALRQPSPEAPRREGPGFIVSYGNGRRCAAPGCITTLSRYNGGDLCAAHANRDR